MGFVARREAKRIPQFEFFGRPTVPADFVEIDRNAQDIMKTCSLEALGVPALTTGNGNCLFNAVSIALTGSEDYAAELRLRTAIEMSVNSQTYKSRDDFRELMDHSPGFEESLASCCTEGSYSSIWTAMALSTVIGVPIKTLYPAMNGLSCPTSRALTKQFSSQDHQDREPCLPYSKKIPVY